MTATLLEPTETIDLLRGELSLDDLVVGAWEGVTAHRTVACPVCEGRLTPRYGAGRAAVGGACSDCGSQLG